MTEYHKINSMFLRDQSKGAKNRLMIEEQAWARPEFEYLATNQWVFTEKVDGTNIRLYYPGNEAMHTDPDWAVHNCIKGRTDKASIPPKLLDRLVRYMNALYLDVVFPQASPEAPVVLYGEGYGSGINGGGKYLPGEVDFVLFDVKVGPYALSRANVVDVANRLQLDVVQEVGRGTLLDAVDLVRTNGFGSNWGGVAVPEGLVCFPSTYLVGANGERVITKIKATDFK